jgi:hypothetical protein
MGLTTDLALLPSEERTATTSTDDVRSAVEDCGVLLFLNVTDAPPEARAAKEEETEKEKEELADEEAAEEGTLKVVIEAKDEVSGNYLPITAFAVTKKAKELGAGTTLAYMLSAGAAETAAVANLEGQALPLPKHWRVTVTHSAVGKWTYSLGHQFLS